ncbi:MAG: peptide chain release factor N(5)-glutamine methyltransferase [Pseudomonadota bacterium]
MTDNRPSGSPRAPAGAGAIAATQTETLEAVVHRLAKRFGAAGSQSPALDARLLVCKALGLDEAAYIRQGRELLAPEAGEGIERLAARREAGEPMAYLLGSKEFWGLTFTVDRHVLIPRPDSETLIEAALARLTACAGTPTVVDFGTGSGNLLLSLLVNAPHAVGIGLDRSLPALELAAMNARRHGCSERAWFACGDWGEALEVEADLVVANPPYIPHKDWRHLMSEVRDFEPTGALIGGETGLVAYPGLLAWCRRHLKASGQAFFEFGQDQEDAVAQLAKQSGFDRLSILKDLSGKPRCLNVLA